MCVLYTVCRVTYVCIARCNRNAIECKISLSLPLSQGKLLQGRLQVSSRQPREEAEVVISGERGGGEEGRVLVRGVSNRNRAIHNDRVALRLLPPSQTKQSEWVYLILLHSFTCCAINGQFLICKCVYSLCRVYYIHIMSFVCVCVCDVCVQWGREVRV